MGSLNLKLIYLYLLIQRKNRPYLWGRGVTTNKFKFHTLICRPSKKSKSMYILAVLLFKFTLQNFFPSIEHQFNEHFNWYNWWLIDTIWKEMSKVLSEAFNHQSWIHKKHIKLCCTIILQTFFFSRNIFGWSISWPEK